jgi:hypothetical protein
VDAEPFVVGVDGDDADVVVGGDFFVDGFGFVCEAIDFIVEEDWFAEWAVVWFVAADGEGCYEIDFGFV